MNPKIACLMLLPFVVGCARTPALAPNPETQLKTAPSEARPAQHRLPQSVLLEVFDPYGPRERSRREAALELLEHRAAAIQFASELLRAPRGQVLPTLASWCEPPGCQEDLAQFVKDSCHTGQCDEQALAPGFRGIALALLGLSGSPAVLPTLHDSMWHLPTVSGRALAAFALLSVSRSPADIQDVRAFQATLAANTVFGGEEEAAALLRPGEFMSGCDDGGHMFPFPPVSAKLSSRLFELSPRSDFAAVAAQWADLPSLAADVQQAWLTCKTSAACYLDGVEREQRSGQGGPRLWLYGIYSTEQDALALVPLLSKPYPGTALMARIIDDRVTSPTADLVRRVQGLARALAEPVARPCGRERPVFDLARRLAWRYQDLADARR